jgi:hypothetical protein
MARCCDDRWKSPCDPWSVLKISGTPNFDIASSSASMQKSAVIVFESLNARTLRLATSRIATRSIKPCAIGKYVISLAQTWFARSIARPESRYG